MSRGRGTLTMQRLGVRLIERRNPEDAIVLGDAMQAEGLDGLITGRSRPVMFRVMMTAGSDTYTRITSRNERHMIAHTRALPRVEPDAAKFFVQGYETIYNVGRFAAKPDVERWGEIWTMWMTPRRATYRALVEARLLPRSIRWHEVRWENVLHLPDPADIVLAHALYLDRVPPKRKKPIGAYLFTVVRRHEDNPRAWERHFGEEKPR